MQSTPNVELSIALLERPCNMTGRADISPSSSILARADRMRAQQQRVIWRTEQPARACGSVVRCRGSACNASVCVCGCSRRSSGSERSPRRSARSRSRVVIECHSCAHLFHPSVPTRIKVQASKIDTSWQEYHHGQALYQNHYCLSCWRQPEHQRLMALWHHTKRLCSSLSLADVPVGDATLPLEVVDLQWHAEG